jgi:hypothetical protein
VWPARVDLHLDAGVTEDSVDRWVQSDRDLLDLAANAGKDTARQLSSLNTMIKATAPQALIVAS